MGSLNMPQRFADSLITLMLVRNGYRVFEASLGHLQAFRGKEEFEVSVRSCAQPLRRQRPARFHAEVDERGNTVRLSKVLAEKMLHRDPKVQIEILDA